MKHIRIPITAMKFIRTIIMLVPRITLGVFIFCIVLVIFMWELKPTPFYNWLCWFIRAPFFGARRSFAIIARNRAKKQGHQVKATLNEAINALRKGAEVTHEYQLFFDITMKEFWFVQFIKTTNEGYITECFSLPQKPHLDPNEKNHPSSRWYQRWVEKDSDLNNPHAVDGLCRALHEHGYNPYRHIIKKQITA